MRRIFSGMISELFLFQIKSMIRLAVIFLVISVLSAVIGFAPISIGNPEIAKIFYYIFVLLFIVTLLGHLTRERGQF